MAVVGYLIFLKNGIEWKHVKLKEKRAYNGPLGHTA